MDQRTFLNALKSLFNIDSYQLPELDREQQAAFLRDPVRYFIAASDERQEAIWREIEKRQPPVMKYAGIAVDELARSGVLGWHPGDDA
jgi:hypothetical protein